MKKQGTWGSYYAASSYTNIDPAYGTENDFKELIKTAHFFEMKVIIDWVANHTGYDHQWTKEHADWYRKDEQGNFTELNGWVDVIDLNYEIPALRKGMIDAMKHWVQNFNIDGFRCDMARTVPIDFWVEARGECDVIKPLFWLAECEILNYHEAFDLTYGWEVMRAFDKYFKDEMKMQEIHPLLHNYAQYPIGSRKLLFTSNHDENTCYGTEYEKYGVCAKAMAVLSCTWPGIPLMYSGQGKPNTIRLAFFEKDFIDWEGNVELHDFYKTLLMLHKKNKALQESASVLMLQTNCDNVLAYLCRRQHDKLLVLMNLGKEPARFHINHPALPGNYINLFSAELKTINRMETFSFNAGDYLVYHVTHQL